MSGDGRSGLPKPRSITSAPARRASTFNESMIVKTYGGRAVIRRNSITPTLPARSLASREGFGSQKRGTDRPGRWPERRQPNRRTAAGDHRRIGGERAAY